ncbi:MAG: hypothetical protein B6240_00385 [Desulfobacteraceae bacterium 4572_87]|nr:MAG: hypothetical protein B6240_00385 [Desulfobacteraceae bacterium 4572_87]
MYKYKQGNHILSSHNPKVVGSNPAPATKTNTRTYANFVSPFFIFLKIKFPPNFPLTLFHGMQLFNGFYLGNQKKDMNFV